MTNKLEQESQPGNAVARLRLVGLSFKRTSPPVAGKHPGSWALEGGRPWPDSLWLILVLLDKLAEVSEIHDSLYESLDAHEEDNSRLIARISELEAKLAGGEVKVSVADA